MTEARKLTKIETYAHVAQIVTALFVVIALVQISLNLDENTRVARNTAHQSLLSMKSEWDSWLIQNEDLAVVMAGQRRTDSDVLRFERYVTSGLNIWEYAFYSHKARILGRAEWEAWNRSFSGQVREAGWGAVWDKYMSSYAEDFIEHVDAELGRTLSAQETFGAEAQGEAPASPADSTDDSDSSESESGG